MQDSKKTTPARFHLLELYFSDVGLSSGCQGSVSLLLIEPELKRKFNSFNRGDWRLIEDGVTVPRLCFEATTTLCGEKFATASQIIPFTKMLLAFYFDLEKECSGDPDSMKKEFVSSLLRNLLMRFDGVEDVRILAQATPLDPRFKNRAFRKGEKKKNELATLNNELKDCSFSNRQQALCITEPEDKEPVRKQGKKSGIWESFDEDIRNQNRRTVVGDVSDVDLRNYLALPCESRGPNPCDWWVREGRQRFPSTLPAGSKVSDDSRNNCTSRTRVFLSWRDSIWKKESPLR